MNIPPDRQTTPAQGASPSTASPSHVVTNAPNPLKLRGQVPMLDGVRGIAVTLVLMGHFVPGGDAHSLIGRIVKQISSFGFLGVDIFFVLSGFLITGILLKSKTDSHYFRNFYARRCVRIFPLYYAVLILAFLILPLFHRVHDASHDRLYHVQEWLWVYASNIYGAFSHERWTFNAGWIRMDHFWSLAVEEHFYLLWPMAVYLLNRRQLMGLIAGIIGLAISIRIGLTVTHCQTLAFYMATPCRADALAIGSWLALVGEQPQHSARLRKLAWPILVGMSITLVLTDPFQVQEIFFFTMVAVTAASAIVILLSLSPTNPLARAINNQPLRTLGKYSYGVYVLHPFILGFMQDELSYQTLSQKAHSGAAGVFLFFVIGFAFSLAAAWLSWNLLERHFLKLKRYFEYTTAGKSDETPASSTSPAVATT